jgi:AraC-like DNA-binding protein
VAEFASTVLVAAVQRALADDGIHLDVAIPDGALLPLAVKRQLLLDVARDHGLLPLLRVGRVLPDLPPDPASTALAAAGSPADLFTRWARLERFLHSRHRIVICDAGPTHLTAEHRGPPDAPPLPAEDALILGVLTALTAATGARDLTVTLDVPDPVTVYRGGSFTAPPSGLDTRRWRFTWTALDPARPRAAVRADADLGSEVRRIVAADLGRRWTLASLAAEVGMSARSLQRHLAGAGGFTTVVGAARAHAAAELLMRTAYPLGVVGFSSGYADQSHFTREFKRRTALTPAAFRAAFRPVKVPS